MGVMAINSIQFVMSELCGSVRAHVLAALPLEVSLVSAAWTTEPVGAKVSMFNLAAKKERKILH